MKRICWILTPLLLVAATTGLTSNASADEDISALLKEKIRIAKELEQKLAKAEIVFTAMLTGATEVGVAKSLPPVRLYVLEFIGVKATRGKVPEKAKGHYQIRTAHPPKFPIAGICTIAARMVNNELQIDLLIPVPVEPTEKDDIEQRRILEEAIREAQAGARAIEIEDD